MCSLDYFNIQHVVFLLDIATRECYKKIADKNVGSTPYRRK